MTTRLYKLGTVSVTNGSNIVTGSGTNWANASDKPQAGDLFSLDLDKFYEIIATTNTQITLDRNFAGTTQSGVNYSIVRHSSAGDIQSLNLAISNLINNRESFVDSLDDVVSGDADEVTHVNRFNQSKQIPTLKKARDDFAAVQAQAESLVGSIVLPNQADFESRHEGKYAGSGFVEWGKHRNSSAEVVNEGIWTHTPASVNNVNLLKWGRAVDSYTGVSETTHPVAYLAGSIINIIHSGTADTSIVNDIKFPAAPDGLDKADGTGRFANLAEAITAGGTSLSASVIHRQDLCILEVFDVNITTSGLPLYPYGNTQYGGSWTGITLADNLVAQGYSAFHVGDTTTKGKGFLVNLTNDNHIKFLQNKDNNCYTDNGDIIQRQYRIRTIAGLEGDWRLGEVETFNSAGYGLRFKTSANKFVQPQGIKTTPPSWGLEYTDAVYYNKTTALANSPTRDRASDSHYVVQFGGAGHTSSEIAYNGNCWAIPIALVQRRNKGAYHPVYNIAGCSGYRNASDPQFVRKWYDALVNGSIDSMAFCMDRRSQAQVETHGADSASDWAGSIVSGYSGRPDNQHHDVIYASDVLDLRLSAHKVSAEVTANNDAKKAIGGTKRGWEAMPFTEVYSQTLPTFTGSGWVNGAYPNHNHNGNTVSIYYWGWGQKRPSIGDYIQGGDDKYYKVVYVYASNSTVQISVPPSEQTDVYNWIKDKAANAIPVYTIHNEPKPYYQAEPTWTDIIADPAVLATTFPDGVAGQWIPTIPDGTNKTYPLSRKKTGWFGRPYTTGGSWGDAVTDVFDPVKNSHTTTSWGSNHVMLVNYKAKANFTEPSTVHSFIGVLPKYIFCAGYHSITYGNLLHQSMFGKVAVGASWDMLNPALSVKKIPVTDGNKISADPASGGLAHEPIDLNNSNNSFAAKYTHYPVNVNGRLGVLWIGQEVKYDSAKDHADEFESKDGTTAQAYAAGTIYRITGMELDYIVMCHDSGATHVFGSFTPDGKGNYLSNGGDIYFSDWDGNGYGDNGTFTVGDNSAVITDDNENEIVRATHLQMTQYLYTEGM